jgi:hypothetical protein
MPVLQAAAEVKSNEVRRALGELHRAIAGPRTMISSEIQVRYTRIHHKKLGQSLNDS